MSEEERKKGNQKSNRKMQKYKAKLKNNALMSSWVDE
jgi:hypothetical protein